jgi:twitching motility two-component system response regulator PilG
MIVAVDDSQTVRKVIKACLERAGYRFEAFHSGEDLLSSLYLRAMEMSLLIVDVVLPGIDGYEVTRRIRAMPEFKDVIIIMISRRDGVVDKLKGRLAGANEYIRKPFKTQEIVNLVQSYIGGCSV